VRDYKHYLDSTPTPADAPQVKLELEKVQRARKAEQKGNLHAISPFSPLIRYLITNTSFSKDILRKIFSLSADYIPRRFSMVNPLSKYFYCICFCFQFKSLGRTRLMKLARKQVCALYLRVT
jgi:hypothetical protein